MIDDLLQSLNPAQRQAVEYCNGPQLVIAGAGSGKTRVLTYKIAYLLQQGMLPDAVMALTFTNKAAREMKSRIASLVGTQAASRLWMGTFHSILLRILRCHADRIGMRCDFSIYDQADSRSLVKLIVTESGLDEKQYRPASVAAAISNIKNALISPERYAADRAATDADNRNGHPMLAHLYKMYRDRCRVAQAMDFDDILYYANLLLRDNKDITELYANRFEYVLVDEYQDTNFAQSLIVSRLTQKHRRLCVVGDDAQSIYAFRGANIANILDMNERWPDLKTFKLEKNYRSTQNIVDAAGSLISHNRAQIPKQVYSENELGEKIDVLSAFSDYEEAAMVAGAVSRRQHLSGASLEDMAVLYRTNAQSRTLEEALRHRAIPYRIYGGLTFYQRKEVKDALAYFRLAVNPDDDEALRRVINLPARGIGDTTMKKVRQTAIHRGLPMFAIISAPEAVALPVSKSTASKLKGFAEMINLFQQQAPETDAFTLGRDIFRVSGLGSMFSLSSTPEEVSKKENLNELLAGLKEFVERRSANDEHNSMSDFLNEVSLLTDQDTNEDTNEAKITLMTIHAAKGLEFDHVYITGLEDSLFPSAPAMEDAKDMEEERRLLYVAITRARKTVMLSYAAQRFRNGQTVQEPPSRFLQEIDRRYMKGDLPEMYAQKNTHYDRRDSVENFGQRHIYSNPTSYTSRHTVPHPSGQFTAASSQKSVIHPTLNRKSPSATMHLTPVRRNVISATPSPVNKQNTSKPNTAINTPFKPGETVCHGKFGIGAVIEYIPEPEPMVEVNFRDFGHKKLILRFATLTKI